MFPKRGTAAALLFALALFGLTAQTVPVAAQSATVPAAASTASPQTASDSLMTRSGLLGKALLDIQMHGSGRAPASPAPAAAAPLSTVQPPPDGAIAYPQDYYGDSATRIVGLSQNWDNTLTEQYYFTSQGSDLMDYDVFINLEQLTPDRKNLVVNALMRDAHYMSQYRYLPQSSTSMNPDGLSVGLVKMDGMLNSKIGFTCAACHTTQINYQGTGIRVSGAPTLANFVMFLTDLETTLNYTYNDHAAFDRFAQRVLGDRYYLEYFLLKYRLGENLQKIQTYNNENTTDLVDGFGRVDAVGRIYNMVLADVHSTTRVTPNAPVSYPFLWDGPHHDYVQWPALTSNAGPGALGRNAGEVIGVFGDLLNIGGYTVHSSVDAPALVNFERWLFDLWSPQWPSDILPAPNSEMAAAGQAIYMDRCVACHRIIDRTDAKRQVYAQIYDVALTGTDPREVQNAMRTGNTGMLDGTPQTALNFAGAKFGDTALIVSMLTRLVEDVMLLNIESTIEASKDAYDWGHGLMASAKQGQLNPQNPLAGYKARPLNGIWATAPYLHNGSVPTLDDLLKPVAERPARFVVGRMEYDPVRVGYKSDITGTSDPYIYDTSLDGNRNTGHTYGTDLSPLQRQQLLEFLKTL